MSLTQDIKEFGLDLGYNRVGITTADPFPEYAGRLQERGESYAWFLPDETRLANRLDPRHVWPEAKSIIVLVLDYFRTSFPPVFDGKVARLYTSGIYLSQKHRLNGARRQLFLDFLTQNKVQINPRATVPDRLAACRTGATTFGKNNFVFMDGAGSFVSPFCLVTDTDLEPDPPSMTVDCPPNCTACIDACPTKALYAPLRLNPQLCIAYATFMTQDNYIPGITSHIPPDIRELMGQWIHGCDICQNICPRNQKRMKANLPPNEWLETMATDFDLRKVLNLSDDFYNRRVKPIMHHYIREKKYFQRNAAIALGNTLDPAFIPDLAQAMTDPEPLVRAYAAWALGRIGGEKAKAVLGVVLQRETSDLTRKEIEIALTKC
jgi:epoxyqueuosine reductase